MCSMIDMRPLRSFWSLWGPPDFILNFVNLFKNSSIVQGCAKPSKIPPQAWWAMRKRVNAFRRPLESLGGPWSQLKIAKHVVTPIAHLWVHREPLRNIKSPCAQLKPAATLTTSEKHRKYLKPLRILWRCSRLSGPPALFKAVRRCRRPLVYWSVLCNERLSFKNTQEMLRMCLEKTAEYFKDALNEIQSFKHMRIEAPQHNSRQSISFESAWNRWKPFSSIFHRNHARPSGTFCSHLQPFDHFDSRWGILK